MGPQRQHNETRETRKTTLQYNTDRFCYKECGKWFPTCDSRTL